MTRNFTTAPSTALDGTQAVLSGNNVTRGWGKEESGKWSIENWKQVKNLGRVAHKYDGDDDSEIMLMSTGCDYEWLYCTRSL